MGFGKTTRVIAILGSGYKMQLMVMVYMNGKTGIDTRVNGKVHCGMVKDLIFLLTVIFLSVSISMVERKDMGSIVGLTEMHTAELL